jgi:predicted secreted hydrolase
MLATTRRRRMAMISLDDSAAIVTAKGWDHKIPYREADHGSFEEEWPPHEGVVGWWYVTGYLQDISNPDHLYSYQYTQFNFPFSPEAPNIRNPIYQLNLTFTDFQTGQYISEEVRSPATEKVYANEDSVLFKDTSLVRGKNSITLVCKGDRIEYSFELNIAKSPVWHADNGVLVMGLPNDPKERTVYYSYTNLPTTGKVSYVNEVGKTVTLQVEGKSWLDRQWGPALMPWEWFSLRFFDNEEVMLFAFPNANYQDATYIDAKGETRIFSNYTYTPMKTVKVKRLAYSMGWDLNMPGIKEEHYRIVPFLENQYNPVGFKVFPGLPANNSGYFEVTCKIINDDGAVVGYAFAEILPRFSAVQRALMNYFLKRIRRRINL